MVVSRRSVDLVEIVAEWLASGLVFCPPGERREMIFGLVISFSMWQCAGHGDAAGPGFVH